MLIEHLQGGLDVLYQESILPEERQCPSTRLYEKHWLSLIEGL